MTKRSTTILTIFGIAVFLAALFLSRRVWTRFDLTESKTYTISEISRNLYKEIPGQVEISYYVSDRLKSLHPMPVQIEYLLREYAAYSRGKIHLVVRDPVKANVEKEVEGLGIQAQQIQTMEQNETSFAMVYTGIVIRYQNKIEVLPVVFSVDSLEYDMTSRIRNMVRGIRRRAGIIIADQFRSWQEDFSYVNQAFLQSGYELQLIVPGQGIPDSLPILFIVGGVEEFDDWALYRIDRYIQLGGRVFFAVTGVNIKPLEMQAVPFEDKGLLSMLAFYGAEVRQKLVLDSSALTMQYQTRGADGALQTWINRYPLWIGVRPENGNPNHPVSAHFAGVDIYWASPIMIAPPPGVEGTALFTTSPDGWLMENDFITDPAAEARLKKDYLQTKGVYTLAAALSGIFPSWFTGKPKPVRVGSVDELPGMPSAAIPARIIVLSDVEALTNFSQYTDAVERNLNFLLQAADWLRNEEDIIGIRSHVNGTNRLDKITNIEKRASAMTFSQILNLGIIPLLVIVAGIAYWYAQRVPRKTGAGPSSFNG